MGVLGVKGLTKGLEVFFVCCKDLYIVIIL